jgi:hypothetical protein
VTTERVPTGGTPLRRTLGAALAVVALFALALTTATGAQSQEEAPASGSAQGLEATIFVLDVDPTPRVECPPDDDDSVANINEGNEFGSITIGVLDVECATDDDGVLTAFASATRVSITDAEAGSISAELMEAECSANGEPEGSSEISGLELRDGEGTLDEEFELTGEPNQELDVGIATLIFNQQETIENEDGSTTLWVDALYIDAGELGFASISTVECTTSVLPTPVTEPPVTEPPITAIQPPPPVTEAPRAAVPARAQPTFTG